jgi:predicted nucleotidyltransferase
MKELKFKQELIAYASGFVSFLLPKVERIKEIILFGSAARGEAEKESDIDLFFDIEKKEDEEKIKKLIKEELKKFYKSKIAETWFLKGIKNLINVNVGVLEEWKLKRSIISEGISLYGKYKEIPKNLKSFVFFNIEPIKNITKRNRIIREVFGRKEKNYFKKGILEEFNSKKLSASSFIVHKEYADKILELLGKEKIDYRFFEFWTDNINY